MGKNKLKHFEEMKTFRHSFVGYSENLLTEDFYLKGKWNSDFFENTRPIVLELGCGKGEYTIGLARKNPEKNFIGIDIKGSRMWHGARAAEDEKLKNVAFYRGTIEFINKVFANNEVSEIWITFPDPQKERYKKRLSSARFLELYKEITTDEAYVNLKTDSKLLYFFTNELIKLNDLEVDISTNDLYKSKYVNEELSIKTYYENKYLEIDDTITYTRFKLRRDIEILNPDTREAEKEIKIVYPNKK